MIKKLMHQLLERRHYWRTVGFSELSELYTSTMLRSLGLSLIGIFVPFYLYQLGFPLPTVILYLVGVYAFRMMFDVLSGYIVARIGPKHTILVSNLCQIAFLGLLLSLPTYGWPLWLLAILAGASLSMFFVAYHVDFSKIMHELHGGKELGFMTIMERIGAALGPVVGGVIAALFGPEYTITIAIILFMGAVIPLFFTAEPTRVHQKLAFRGLPYGELKRDFISRVGMGMDNSASLILWPLFAAMTILAVNPYAGVGLVTSLGIIASILTARFIGQVVDRDKGLVLFHWSLIANSVVHVLRTVATGFGGAVLVNTANEAATAGYSMPYTKGMYGRADALPGFRIVYIIMVEIAVDAGKVALLLIAWGLMHFMQPIEALVAVFLIAAFMTPIMAVQNFPALKRRVLAWGTVY